MLARFGAVAALLASTLVLASPPAQAAGTVPVLDHVFVIVMENHAYGEIIGSSQAPYINSLLSSGALATSYYAVSHPSLPNYIALTSGSTYGIASDCTTCFLNVSHIGDSLEAAGSTWKAYEEGMPSACFVGDSYPYAQKHDPFIYYNDVRTNAARCQKDVVPYSQLGVDLQATATTPNFAFITPNMCNDMHDCSISTGDSWLQSQVPQILNSAAFKTQRSVLALTWDEDDSSASNQVPLILIGSGVNAGFQTSLTYDHYSLLRTIEAARGAATLTSNDSGAAPITDVFGAVAGSSTPCASVSATTSPASPQAPGTTVQLTATAAGCPNPRYEFWSLAPGSQTWTLAQAYGTTPTYTWSTAGKIAGTWRFSIWARDASSGGTAGNVNGTWDAYAMPAYTLQASTSADPCTAVTWTGSPAATAATGTAVTMTASATGCTSPRYQFEMLAPQSQAWTILQAYSTSPAYTWTTTGLQGGTYHLIVMAEDTTSSGLSSNWQSSWDAYVNQAYVLTSNACTSVTASASGTNPVTITAHASGCPNPQYQLEMLVPGSSVWVIGLAYSPNDIFTWNTTTAARGTFRLIVKVRDNSSSGTSGAGNPNGTWDAYVLFSYTLN